jgi:predicted amidohydrolase
MFLRAQGAAAILLPRATERGTYKSWRLVMQAMARVSSCYLLSVNRPDLDDPPIGGPSVVIGPDGEVLAEGTESWLTFTLKHEEIVKARAAYPGYLALPQQVYAQSWGSV